MKKRGKIDLGPNIIFFGSVKCTGCIAQFKTLKDHFDKINKPLKVRYYDVLAKGAPGYLNIDGSIITPSWYFPSSKTIAQGFITPTKFINLMGNVNFGNKTATDVNFNQLERYGKNFKSEQQGFQIKNSWQNYLKTKWGNVIDSGTLGRELGPGNVDGIYSKSYYNKPRMLRPGDDLSTSLYTNRNCNVMNNPKAQSEMTGLFYDDNSGPGLVTNQFGKKSRFGWSLYSQMGPAYKNKPLNMDSNAGGLSKNVIRPSGVQNKNLYIGQSPAYNPLNVNNYKINTKLGEGTEIILDRKNKIGFRN